MSGVVADPAIRRAGYKANFSSANANNYLREAWPLDPIFTS